MVSKIYLESLLSKQVMKNSGSKLQLESVVMHFGVKPKSYHANLKDSNGKNIKDPQAGNAMKEEVSDGDLYTFSEIGTSKMVKVVYLSELLLEIGTLYHVSCLGYDMRKSNILRLMKLVRLKRLRKRCNMNSFTFIFVVFVISVGVYVFLKAQGNWTKALVELVRALTVIFGCIAEVRELLFDFIYDNLTDSYPVVFKRFMELSEREKLLSKLQEVANEAITGNMHYVAEITVPKLITGGGGKYFSLVIFDLESNNEQSGTEVAEQATVDDVDNSVLSRHLDAFKELAK